LAHQDTATASPVRTTNTTARPGPNATAFIAVPG
jgi:hypothetical protein